MSSAPSCQCAVRSCPAGQPADGTRSSLTEPLTSSQPCVRRHRQIATEPADRPAPMPIRWAGQGAPPERAHGGGRQSGPRCGVARRPPRRKFPHLPLRRASNNLTSRGRIRHQCRCWFRAYIAVGPALSFVGRMRKRQASPAIDGVAARMVPGGMRHVSPGARTSWLSSCAKRQ